MVSISITDSIKCQNVIICQSLLYNLAQAPIFHFLHDWIPNTNFYVVELFFRLYFTFILLLRFECDMWWFSCYFISNISTFPSDPMELFGFGTMHTILSRTLVPHIKHQIIFLYQGTLTLQCPYFVSVMSQFMCMNGQHEFFLFYCNCITHERQFNESDDLFWSIHLLLLKRNTLRISIYIAKTWSVIAYVVSGSSNVSDLILYFLNRKLLTSSL